ncbi:MAG: P1 family peptidase [Maricaulis sp.]|uniref:P1 family peptidase n=1 Tax=Maricaulis sp. TaxID=1486257 RepID=UPI001B2DC26B|nr:P1 family peptidase [Maricaulis sp.]MBO6730055.1 P1 family peptidase [Maricaulis sp.]MBO6846846.1 P1 family peptidase [Maricaulis sp.]MBO6877602.1 P1 family peptidase [Maricaulis sp.]MDM7984584.1 P1 family peptidase [Maricaulis sp.]
MAMLGKNNTITDVAGIKVGHSADERARTGVTVILPDERAVCAVDVRGGGPGTRETDALAAHTLVDAVDAVVLSGGSSYGLASMDGVAAALGARGQGFGLVDLPGVPKSPVVPGAILYDLANGGDKAWGEDPPYRALGQQALANVSTEVELGRAGAGFGAMAGQRSGGIGSASIVSDDGFTIGAIVGVNAFGSVMMPGTDAFWAWPWEIDGEFGGRRPPADWSAEPEDWGEAKINPAARENTTIACIATDADLTPGQAQRLAIMAQDGFARAIRPVHTPFDGDVVFALSTGRKALGEKADFTLTRLGSLAADCLARAVARGVFEASKA